MSVTKTKRIKLPTHGKLDVAYDVIEGEVIVTDIFNGSGDDITDTLTLDDMIAIQRAVETPTEI